MVLKDFTASNSLTYDISQNNVRKVDLYPGTYTTNGDGWNMNWGNIGIDVAAPTEKLEVNGKVKATHFIGDGSGLTNISGTSHDHDAVYLKKSDSNIVGGYAKLNTNNKIDVNHLPDVVVGGVVYKGVWNASTNTPTIPSAIADNKGHYYKVNVAGTTNIDTINQWTLGDWIISNGSTWDKIDAIETITSVNTKVGDVVLDGRDIKVSTGYTVPTNASAIAIADTMDTAFGKLSREITNLKSSTGGKFKGVYSDTASYEVADVVVYNNTIYSCTTAITSPEAFTANKWQILSGSSTQTQSDWNETNSSNDAFIRNKPTIPTTLAGLTSDSTHRTITDAERTTWNAKQSTSEKNQNNGYAGLDASGKLADSVLPDSIVGGMKYQGAWNASTNTPTIPSAATANKGYYYKVNTAGSTTINGNTGWAVGDWIVSNGTTWDKIDNTDSVTSVNSKTGAVVLAKADIGLGNVDNTSDANKPISTLTQTALNGKAASTHYHDRLRVGSTDKVFVNATGVGLNTTDPKVANHLNGRTLLGGDVAVTEAHHSALGDNIANAVSPTRRTGSETGVENVLRMTRPGLGGGKYNMSAEYKIGTSTAGLAAKTQLERCYSDSALSYKVLLLNCYRFYDS